MGEVSGAFVAVPPNIAGGDEQLQPGEIALQGDLAGRHLKHLCCQGRRRQDEEKESGKRIAEHGRASGEGSFRS
jgi:hypothetical protein